MTTAAVPPPTAATTATMTMHKTTTLSGCLGQKITDETENGRNRSDADIFDLYELEKKEDLIEQAQTRLRRIVLEERLADVMRQVIEIQSETEFVRVDAEATLDALRRQNDSDHGRMEALERRCQKHLSQLAQLRRKAEHNSAFSMTRLSSVFSRSSAEPNHDDDEDDAKSMTSKTSSVTSSSVPSEAERQRRRSRVKQHRQRHQERLRAEQKIDLSISKPDMHGNHERFEEDGDDEFTELQWMPKLQQEANGRPAHGLEKHTTLEEDEQQSVASSELSHPQRLRDVMPDFVAERLVTTRHPLSPITAVNSYKDESYFIDEAESLSWSKAKVMQPSAPLYDNECKDDTLPWNEYDCSRNVSFDHTMSLIDSLSENAFNSSVLDGLDSWFVDSQKADFCHATPTCAYAEEENQRQYIRKKQRRLNYQRRVAAACDLVHTLCSPTALCYYGITGSWMLVGAATGWALQWLRFLVVLAAAILISLIKGPYDIVD
ncbi:hypothetical protein BCR43DRAFT_526455 [Syncephalastrum racemosum]|uniref:Uncharacterized protein n=1 Tax=Syncephalastrum racemosum TaxID=13706 RepID=A0A1X2H6D4_SYNRA|nr:hypothetical protein BCR43DRAFT_526455 [Syncephalastrum racemosum]